MRTGYYIYEVVDTKPINGPWGPKAIRKYAEKQNISCNTFFCLIKMIDKVLPYISCDIPNERLFIYQGTAL